MPEEDDMEYFTLRIWTEEDNSVNAISNRKGHVSLEMHDGTYISVFRSQRGICQSNVHNEDIARLGRDSDVTLKLFYKEHLRHPERIKNWLESYKQGEIIFDPKDSASSVVYSVLVRSGCPSLDVSPFKLNANDMKEFAFGVLRCARRRHIKNNKET